MTGRESFSRFRKLISLLVSIFSILGYKGNYFLLRYFRNTNGKIGLLLRYVFLKNTANYVGINVSIQPGVYLLNVKKLNIGNNVSIHPMCYLDAGGGIEILNDVSIAHNCSILSTNHDWSDKTIPIKYNAVTSGKVVINEDVWIGCGVRVLAGVTISSRSVIAAGAVVNRNLGPNIVAGGVPARLIKNM